MSPCVVVRSEARLLAGILAPCHNSSPRLYTPLLIRAESTVRHTITQSENQPSSLSCHCARVDHSGCRLQTVGFLPILEGAHQALESSTLAAFIIPCLEFFFLCHRQILSPATGKSGSPGTLFPWSSSWSLGFILLGSAGGREGQLA